MTKLLKTFIPTILGILTIWGIFKIEDFIHIKQFGPHENVHIDSDILFIFPLVIIALIIQFFLTLPIWAIFKNNRKIINLTLIQFFTLVRIIGGLFWGFIFWTRQFGIRDFIVSISIGTILIGIYWAVNLLTLNQLDIYTRMNKNDT